MNSTPADAVAPSVLAHSRWDAIPVMAGIGHVALIGAFVLLIDRLPWWGVIGAGLLYAYLIAWNINGVAHNFIHNPYFRAAWLNRVYSVMLSLTMGFSQVMYNWVHTRHHFGNMDRPGADGNTVDPISIYRFGANGAAENVWSYTFKSYWRDDPAQIYRQIAAKSPREARFALVELACVIGVYGGLTMVNWRAVVVMAPFYYIGHSLSSLVGYYEHFRANPDAPIAWGVSCYGRLYNLVWLNNGYHAEHHFRPRLHWTRMKAYHREIAAHQREAGVRVIGWPHFLGFLAASRSDPRR